MRHDEEEDDELEDDDDDGYIPCPYCGKPMYEEAGYCSGCERWISQEDAPRKPLPPWMVVVILMCLAGLILGALQLF